MSCDFANTQVKQLLLARDVAHHTHRLLRCRKPVEVPLLASSVFLNMCGGGGEDLMSSMGVF